MKRWWIALVMAVVAVSSVQAKRQAPLIDPPRVVVKNSGGQSLSAEQIRGAIAASAKSLGWQINTDTPGTLLLSYNKQNKHYVVVRADYDAEGYQVRYVSSTNLNFETPPESGPLIHPSYNIWVDNLIKHVKFATDVSPGLTGAQAAPAVPAASR